MSSENRSMECQKGIRLNRFLAMCGLGSRRDVEVLISGGRISIDGKVVTDLSARVTERSKVSFDGNRILPETRIYLVMNKPLGVVCAVRDKYYDTVIDILPEKYHSSRIFPVGRLDMMSSGLLILTNDGEISQRIIHPSSGIHKTYEVLLDRRLSQVDMEKWRKGLLVEQKQIKPVSVVHVTKRTSDSWIKIVLAEGLKREIRLMARALGYSVRSLKRIGIGRMQLHSLERGKVIQVTDRQLMEMIRKGGKV